jgi:hypothetical protein
LVIFSVILAGCSANEVISFTPFANDLNRWIGGYEFYEFASPNINMNYTVNIYEDDGKYYADIIIDGFQTMARLKAIVQGDSKSIDLIFDSYLPENVQEIYKKGCILLTFGRRRCDQNLLGKD